jgi:Protein kinase domain
MQVYACGSIRWQLRSCRHLLTACLLSHRAGIFDEEQARLYTAEIVAAIAHLHSLHIVHRDLKPVRTRTSLLPSRLFNCVARSQRVCAQRLRGHQLIEVAAAHCVASTGWTLKSVGKGHLM